MPKNLFDIAVPERGEFFRKLYETGSLSIELIVSSDTPGTQIYDQPHDEAVFLLEGSATLSIEGNEVRLAAGDYLCIPAHTRHSVLKTEKGTRWLAIHSKEKLC